MFLRSFGAGFTVNFDQQDDNSQSSDAKDLGEEPFALPSSSKWEVADRQEKMGKDNFIVNIIKIAKETEVIGAATNVELKKQGGMYSKSM